MKKILFLVVVLLLGLGLGGGAAFGTMQVLGIGAGPAKAKTEADAEDKKPLKFVPTGKILTPLVYPDGHLAGYANFEIQLQVDEAKADFVSARMPLLLHAINMRTYRTPMTAGPDGMLPNLDTFRTVVQGAAAEAFGKDVVHKVAVTAATPA